MMPDFDKYSNQDLLDVFDNIDRESYPDRFEKLYAVMFERGLIAGTEQEPELVERLSLDDDDGTNAASYTNNEPEPQYDDTGNYIPNDIPASTRVLNSIIALVVIVYGGYGIYHNELLVPLGRNSAVVIYDEAVLLLSVSIVFIVGRLVTEIVDHYDKRDNEWVYYKLANVCKYVGYGTFAVAIFFGLATGGHFT